jgi:hypothetical protein
VAFADPRNDFVFRRIFAGHPGDALGRKPNRTLEASWMPMILAGSWSQVSMRSYLAVSGMLLGCHVPPSPAPLVQPSAEASAPNAAASDAGVGAPAAADAGAPEGLRGEPMEVQPAQRYRDGAALCAEHVAHSRRSIEESGGWAHLHPTPPRCREVKLPVPFRGDATFRAARAFALDSGLAVETRLAVEVPGGFALTPIAWSYRNDHAALVEPLPGTLESLSVDAGTLVAVVGRTEGSRDERGIPQMVLVRGVVVCRSAEPLICRGYFPTAAAPLLGAKRRPWDATTPWETLAWDRTPSFRLTTAGNLVVAE